VFADSQATVKNIIFTIARIQNINGNLRASLDCDGTDRLEVVFSGVRTLDHATNVDCMQLGQKMGIGASKEAIYMRNSDLDCGHKRLNTTHLTGRGIDHKRPSDWADELVTANTVCLEDAWAKGRMLAEEIMSSEIFDGQELVDFSTYFEGREDTHDFLRLNGKYTGMGDPDHNSDRSEARKPFRSLYDNNYDGEETGSDTDSDYDNDLYQDLSVFPQPGIPTDSPMTSEHDLVESVNKLPVLVSDSSDPTYKFSHYVKVDGKQVLKTSRVPAVLSLHETKSRDRNRRVQGQLRHDQPPNTMQRQSDHTHQSDNLLNDDSLCESLYVASLAHSSKTISLIIVQVSHLLKGISTTRLRTLPWTEVENREQKVSVHGRVLDVCIRESRLWTWTGDILTKSEEIYQTVKATRNQSLVRVPGHLVLHVKPVFRDGSPCWEQGALEKVMNTLWERVSPEGTSDFFINGDSLPDFSSSIYLPYMSLKGTLIPNTKLEFLTPLIRR
jgi:hypothetical protein